jgi:ligand-binding sensor domain-containing protein/AraC-like DNA-binding protein
MKEALYVIIDLILTLLLAFLFLDVYSNYSLAFDFEKPIDKYLVKGWKVQDGLPTDTIRSIAQTPDGYLWIGTAKGIVRFDGVRFEMFETTYAEDEIPNKRKIVLYVDREGILWIGSSGGLTKYENRTVIFYPSEDKFPGFEINCINKDTRDRLWIGTSNNFLYHFEKDLFEVYGTSSGLSCSSISSIFVDSRGNLFVGTTRDGLYRYSYDKFKHVDNETIPHNASINALCEDRNESLWLGTSVGLVRRKENKEILYTTQDGLISNRISALMEDSEGNLWIGTENGVDRIRIDSAGDIVIDNFFKNNNITCFLEDKEKNIWIGTCNSGLMRLKDKIFTTYGRNEGLPEDYFVSLCEDRNHDIWIGSSTGDLCKFSKGAFINIFSDEGAIDLQKTTWIKSLGRDNQGNIWVSVCGKGLIKYSEGDATYYSTEDGLIDNCIISIFCDTNDTIWFGSFNGLNSYHNGQFTFYTVKDGLTGNIVNNIYEDKDHNIWISTSGGITFLENGKFSQKHMRAYLRNIPVTAIYEDREDTFWFATRGEGLIRFREGKLISCTAENGLSSNMIYHILEDERGNFWMSSDRGILCVDKGELNDFADGKISWVNCITYGVSDGMRSCECEIYKSSAIKASNGALWFATKKGVSTIDIRNMRINQLPPPSVIIEKVILDGVEQDNYQELSTYKDVENVEFYFTAPTFTAPENVRFKYKLDGFDKDWIFLETGDNRIVSYDNLPAGDYTFTITACNSQGIWNREGTSLLFTIKISFMKTSYFKALLVLLFLVSGTTGYFLLKKNGLRKRKKYKNSTLDPQKIDDYLRKLAYLLEIEKVYRDDSISLQSLSDRMSLPSYQLSYLINEKLNKSYFDLINSHRIEDAKKQLTDPQKQDLSILEIAYNVGFNTKVAFNNAFKKYTSMTPSQYKNKYTKH